MVKHISSGTVEPTILPRFTDHIIEEGNELFVRIDKLSLEGIVGKRADSLYVGGRTKA